MFRVYVVSGPNSTGKGPAELFADIEKARSSAAFYKTRGLDCRIYRQELNSNGDLIETLVL